jgi:hypothetical protein
LETKVKSSKEAEKEEKKSGNVKDEDDGSDSSVCVCKWREWSDD